MALLNMKKFKILTIAFASLFLSSCLEKLPSNAIIDEDAIQTVSDAEQLMNGIYAAFKSGALYSGYLTLIPDIQADYVHAVEGFRNVYGRYWTWDFNSTDSEVAAVYNGLYTVIGRVNFLLDNMDNVEENLKSEEEFNKLYLYKGEAHFARALAYSELVKLYCKAYTEEIADKEDLGVVISTSYYNKALPKRATLRESYNQIISDLKVAEDNIQTDYYGSNYFTVAAIHGLRARVALYMQDWDTAIEYSSKVINNTTYTLANTKSMATSSQTTLDYMWTDDQAYEIMWKVGFTPTSYGGALGQVFLNYDFMSYTPDYIPSAWIANDAFEATDARYQSYFRRVRTGYPHGLTAIILWKYPGLSSFASQNILAVNQPKVFRLGEQYLIRAEAYCAKENPEYSKAAADITTLRKARYTNYPGSASVSANNWLTVIEQERVRELYMEGFRLHDLKRWGKGFERKAETSTVAPGNRLKINANNPRFVWPIPQHEIEAPGSMIVGNESN